MTTYYVDIPTEDCIAQPDGEFKNVAQFTNLQEAIKFCQEHFVADENGCISLISPAVRKEP